MFDRECLEEEQRRQDDRLKKEIRKIKTLSMLG